MLSKVQLSSYKLIIYQKYPKNHTDGTTVDPSKINFEKKAVLWVMVEWPNSY